MSKGHLQAVTSYIMKYIAFLFFAKPHVVDRLTGDDLMDTCRNAAASSQGLDHWSPSEFRLLALVAFNHLATLLNLIEEGAPRPSKLLHANGAFLCKDPSTPFEPMAYRILLILHTLHGKWATTRLRHLGP